MYRIYSFPISNHNAVTGLIVQYMVSSSAIMDCAHSVVYVPKQEISGRGI